MRGLILGCAGHLLLYAKGPPEPGVQDLALSCIVYAVKSLCWIIAVAESLHPLGSCRELADRGLKGDGDIAWGVEAELTRNTSMMSMLQVRLWDREISKPGNLFHKLPYTVSGQGWGGWCLRWCVYRRILQEHAHWGSCSPAAPELHVQFA